MAEHWRAEYPTVGGYSSASPEGAPRGMYYPQIAQPIRDGPRPVAPPPTASGGPVGVRVTIRPAYRVAPPVQLAPVPADVAPSVVQLDFDLERSILRGANHDRNSESTAVRPVQTVSSPPRTVDSNPSTARYRAMGLGGEALSQALATYGDVQEKVVAFCPAYDMLREMGFAPEAVAGALAAHGNDPERALAVLAP